MLKTSATALSLLLPLGAYAASQEITPGQGSLTDSAGKVWTIQENGSIRETIGGAISYTPGGGGTAALEIAPDGTVHGLDNSGRGWFSLSRDGQTWASSPAPTAQANTASSLASPATPAVPSAPSQTALPTPSTPTPCTPSKTPAFGILQGVIYDDQQRPFIPRGVNIGPQDMTSVAASISTLFPGANFIRLATWKDAPYTIADYQTFVSAMSAKGIVVEIEDHAYPSPPPYTGADLVAESAWFASLASAFKNNPYVWFGTMNEPGGSGDYQSTGPGISAQHLATYNAIRGTGNNAILMMDPFGGGNPGSLGSNGGLTASAYANMTNVVWDLHFYGWVVPGKSSDPATIKAALMGSAGSSSGIAAAQTITGAGGQPIPVVIGEFGDSTDGETVDPNGPQVVDAVVNSGYGFAAWQWTSGGNADVLIQGGGITRMGQQVAAGIKAAPAATSGASASVGCSSASTAPSTVVAQAVAMPTDSSTSTPMPDATAAAPSAEQTALQATIPSTEASAQKSADQTQQQLDAVQAQKQSVTDQTSHLLAIKAAQ